MNQNIDRRDWLKTGLMGLGATLLPAWKIPTADHPPYDYIRLSHNENPYGPSPAARDAIIENIVHGNRYPRESISLLKEEIAKKEGVRPEHILITAGSTEILGLMGLIFGIQKGEIISGHPTFDFLMYYSTNFECDWIKVGLEQQEYPYAQIVERSGKKTRLVFICNPNNPTGTYTPKAEVVKYIKSLPESTSVFIDEAYIEFTEGGISNSLAPLILDHPQVIVGRTFSKIYGMAGLRIGYAIAHEDTIQTMQKFCMGRMITPSVTSVEAARAALQDTSFAQSTLTKTNAAKEMVYDAFNQWGVKHWKSHTNFIWFTTDRFKGDLLGELERRKVHIRDYDHSPGFARVSIGTMKEMESFLGSSKEILT